MGKSGRLPGATFSGVANMAAEFRFENAAKSHEALHLGSIESNRLDVRFLASAEGFMDWRLILLITATTVGWLFMPTVVFLSPS